MKKNLASPSTLLLTILSITLLFNNVIGVNQYDVRLESDIVMDELNNNEGSHELSGNYTIHSRILINGDGDFTPANGVTGGNGTELDPYIIEGWEIDGNDVREHLIDIRNTSAHFSIRDCYLHNTGYDFFGGGMGIYTDNVENMSVTGCYITDTYDGMQLHHTYNSHIYNNNITANRAHAITLAYSDNNLLEYNLITDQQDDGILFGLLDNGAPSCSNTVRNNYIVDNNRYGLLIYRGTENTIYNNVFKGNGDDHALDDATSGDNNWNISTGGNWWHGHTSPDDDGDGIVDDPYDIPGFISGDGDTDELPLVERAEVNYTEEITVELKLQPSPGSDGWEFLSIPLDCNNDSIDSVLNSIDGSYDKLMYYNSTDGSWNTYLKARTDRYNSFRMINHTISFWIHLTNNDVLQLSGTRPSSTTMTLHPGWNMVGYPSEIDRKANETLPTEVSRIGVFNSSREYNLEYISDLTTYTMTAGEGYWVYNSDKGTVEWTVDH